MRDQELILRFYALLYRRDAYDRPMKTFLNRFAGWNRNCQHIGSGELSDIFVSTIDAIAAAKGKDAFRPESSFNAAAFDSIMVGIASRIQSGSAIRHSTIANRIDKLYEDEEYYFSITQATADKSMMTRRLKSAIAAFSK